MYEPSSYELCFQNLAKTVSMEKDAVDENLLYRRRLKKIDDELVSANISAMKFLCRDFIAGARLERVSRGINLFELLEQKQLLGNCDSALLVKMLETVGRCDLARLLDPCSGPSADRLTPYRWVSASDLQVLIEDKPPIYY